MDDVFGDDIYEELVDFVVARKEAMRTDVEATSFTVQGTCKAPYLVEALQNMDGGAIAAHFVRGGKARRASANNSGVNHSASSTTLA